MEGVAVGCVVHEHHVREVSIENTQVLYVHSLGCGITVLAIEAMLDILTIGIEMVQDYISVAAVASSEDYNLEVLGESLEEVDGMRADVDSGFHDLPRWECDGQLDVMRDAGVFIAVYKSFVQVEHKRLFVCITSILPL